MKSREDCCQGFFPQVLAKSMTDRLNKELFSQLQMRAADVQLVQKLQYSCFDSFPESLQHDILSQVNTLRTRLAFTTQSMVPLTGQDVKYPLKLLGNQILLQQRGKEIFVKRSGLQRDCLINLFSGLGQCEEHLPIFRDFGVFQGPSNEGEIVDFLGVSTALDVHCPAEFHKKLSACHSLSQLFACKFFYNNWGRLMPLVDEEYFEWEDVLEIAQMASERDHFAMAEARLGVIELFVWRWVRAAMAFGRSALRGPSSAWLRRVPLAICSWWSPLSWIGSWSNSTSIGTCPPTAAA